MNPITIVVYGVPVAQGRPKFFRRGNHVGAYDPKKSRDYKGSIKMQAIEQLAREGGYKAMPPLYEGALVMSVTAYLPRPKTLPKRVIHHTKRPDAENLSKGICDALQGILFKDDSQIVELIVRKQYGDPPRVTITIGGAEEPDA